jgi:cytochrome c peroxidase
MNSVPRWVAWPMVCLAALLATLAAAEETRILAPGYGPLEYQPPAAGSYGLPPLGNAVDGLVLDSDGSPMQLNEVLAGRLVLMGFIYTHCPDVNGCPLASYVMKQVQERLRRQPDLANRVRLVSLSFDPQLDTPAALRDYARHFRRKGSDWRFLTTASEEDLAPILAGFGQWRQKNYNEDGSYAGSMSHILRVFLLDEQQRIRNIYSTGFLHADTVINDLRTLAMEADAAPVKPPPAR